MLTLTKLPKPFWGEVVITVCYLINRASSAPLNFEVPEKMWSEKNPSYSHLKVFRCKAFAHVSKELRQKLDSKSTPYIFTGYEDEEYGYRLWNQLKKQIIRSKDVFQENQFYEDFEKVSKWTDAEIITPSSTSDPALLQLGADDGIAVNFLEPEKDNVGAEQGEQQPLHQTLQDPLVVQMMIHLHQKISNNNQEPPV